MDAVELRQLHFKTFFFSKPPFSRIFLIYSLIFLDFSCCVSLFFFYILFINSTWFISASLPTAASTLRLGRLQSMIIIIHSNINTINTNLHHLPLPHSKHLIRSALGYGPQLSSPTHFPHLSSLINDNNNNNIYINPSPPMSFTTNFFPPFFTPTIFYRFSHPPQHHPSCHLISCFFIFISAFVSNGLTHSSAFNQ